MSITTAAPTTQFADVFRKFVTSETDPRLRKLREEAFAEFTQTGFPTVKNEDWKYTNVAPILSGQWSVVSGERSDLNEADNRWLEGFNYTRNGFAALNLAFADVKVVRIAKDTSIAEPIELSFAAD